MDRERLLKRGVAEIVSREELERLLEEGRPLRLKMGFDPSYPDIHLGHVVGLRKLRQFQELGHQVILIVGDWTARIGDPSGQSATRPTLSPEAVRNNAQTYLRQFFRVVDPHRTRVVWQSEWFDRFGLAEVLQLAGRFTVAQLLAREDFQKRFQAHQPLSLTELLYPLLQAYDSIAVQADVEFGGTDQKFNLLVGRELQRMMGQRPQQCFLVPLLVGTDGVQKMSKSLGNYIGIEDTPNDMYGKVMSLPDEPMMTYFELLTDVPEKELQEMAQALRDRSLNPMELKKRLAREIVAQFYDEETARKAEAHFEQLFQRRQLPQEMPEAWFKLKDQGRQVELTWQQPGGPSETTVMVHSCDDQGRPQVEVATLLLGLGLVPSKSQARRLLYQGAVEVDSQKLTTPFLALYDNAVVRVGKNRFFRLRRKDDPPSY